MARIVTCAECYQSFDRGYAICATRAAGLQFCSRSCRSVHVARRAADRLADRFWEKVNIGSDDECWTWKEFRDPNGYGRFQIGRRPRLAHRVAFSLQSGTSPGQMHVCHRCDNPPCCNPNHLFLGTARDNVQDMIAKGRRGKHALRGHRNPASKLTTLAASSIFHSNKPAKELALQYGVSKTVIYNIRRRKSWLGISGELA